MAQSLTDSLFYVDAENRHARYPVRCATWNLYEEEIDTIGVPFFSVRIETSYPLQDGAEAPTYREEAFWEINYADNGLRSSKLLTKGSQFFVPVGYDKSLGGYLTNIYEGVHQQSDRNTITILDVDGDCLLIRLEGETIEGTWHDPVTTHTYAKLFVETWFKRDVDQGRGSR